MTQAEIQAYIDEFKSYAALVGLTVDINPLDSPIFKAWLASKYPGLVITPATATSPATITKPLLFGLSQNQLLFAAAGLGLILFLPKKRSKR